MEVLGSSECRTMGCQVLIVGKLGPTVYLVVITSVDK